jgi:hypothetical protein
MLGHLKEEKHRCRALWDVEYGRRRVVNQSAAKPKLTRVTQPTQSGVWMSVLWLSIRNKVLKYTERRTSAKRMRAV